jgi:photosystem II stability/assembly factor-like uncharacterized protein
MRKLFLCCAVTLLAVVAVSQTPETKSDTKTDSKDKKAAAEAGMKYRQVGPFRGGRSLTGVGVPGNPNVYYFGATGGGVWKSTDGALTWSPVLDGENASTTGSIAVALSDPNIVYVGTGEACIRGNATSGDGVYKSVDGGQTWKNVGLKDTAAIGKLIVHPTNPDIVLVAALGHPWGPNDERGIFRTENGGATWQKVLFKDKDTGGVDIAFDPNNPHILFASLWQVRRQPWELSSGGPGSGLYRSADGGTTWKEVEYEGLPKKPYGKIGVAVSADSARIYALIEAAEGGLYRSDDGGHKWQLVNPDRRLRQRAWYYMHITADPRDAGTVYIMNVDFHKSTDGGRSFNKISGLPHGDNHGLWIDPLNTRRMVEVNDGGVTITTDGGKTWSGENNQPTAQIYHVATDNRYPYWLYGAQQDNSSLTIASRGDSGYVDRPDWYPVAGGEAGYILPNPSDPLITYGGEYQGQASRFDKHTGQITAISAQTIVSDGIGAAPLAHRFQWTAPMALSPWDPKVLYHAGERVFVTKDEGKHWETISPDLTRNDKSKQGVSGGPITKDDTGTEYYDTIFALVESSLQKGLIWVGTDDGLVQLTQDGGKTWTNVTPRGIPEWSKVSQIDASTFDAGTAYVAFDRHLLDDRKPYIYKTSDFGKSWTKLVKGLPETAWTRVVRQDPKRKGLLYAGTETGVWISYNDGADWESFKLNLPTTPVHDLVIHDNDLVLATHGRGFWILDDLSPARQHFPEIVSKPFHLFTPAMAIRTHGRNGKRSPLAGDNPPLGAVIDFNLKAVPKEASIEILDNQGHRVRLISSKEMEEPDEQLDPEDEKPKARLEPKAGLNRYVWNLRHDGVPRIPDYFLYEVQEGTGGPVVLPGNYTVKLTVDGKSETAPFVVKLDPRVTIPTADLEAQHAMLTNIRADLQTLYHAVTAGRDLRTQLKGITTRVPNADAYMPLLTAIAELDKKIETLLLVLHEPRNRANEDSLSNGMKLDGQFAGLALYVSGDADGAPNETANNRYAELHTQLSQHLATWSSLLNTDLPSVLNMCSEQKIGAIILPELLAKAADTVK